MGHQKDNATHLTEQEIEKILGAQPKTADERLAPSTPLSRRPIRSIDKPPELVTPQGKGKG